MVVVCLNFIDTKHKDISLELRAQIPLSTGKSTASTGKYSYRVGKEILNPCSCGKGPFIKELKSNFDL